MKPPKIILTLKNNEILTDLEIDKETLDLLGKRNLKELKIKGVNYNVEKINLKHLNAELFILKEKSRTKLKEEELNYYTQKLLIEKYLKQKNELNTKLDLLIKAGKFYAEVKSIKKVLKKIIKEIKENLKVEVVSIFKVDKENKKISFYEFTKGEEELKSIEIEWGKGIVGYVAKNKIPVIANDVSKDERFYKEIDIKTGFKTKNLIAFPLIVQKKLIGVIEVINKIDGEFTKRDLELISLISSQAAIALQNALLYKELEDLFWGTITALANAVETKDPHTSGHVNRVTELSVSLGKKIGLKGEKLRECKLAAILHDIGKIAIPDSILKKPAKLTDEEYEIIKTHVFHGAKILEPIPGMKGVIKAVLHHHERWDGKGYPQGLKKDEIPIIARIIAITDSFDAMNSDRPYRKRLPKDVIINELRKNAGTQFDPNLIEIFLEMDDVKFILEENARVAELEDASDLGSDG